MNSVLKGSISAFALLGAMTMMSASSNAFSVTDRYGNTINDAFTITANAGGSFTVTTDGNFTFGGEDVLIYVVNNSGSTLNSIDLTSHDTAFGFDGDGIDTYLNPSPKSATNPDVTGYGGSVGYFTNISLSQYDGTVNFAGGLSNGSNTYFSLEESLAAAGGGGLGVGTVPLPASAPMFGGAILALGLFGYGMKYRAKTNTSTSVA